MFRNNSFPDEVLDGFPSYALTLQPVTKKQLTQDLTALKNEIEKEL